MSKEKWTELKEIPIDDYLEQKEKEMEKDWHTNTELGLEEQIAKTKSDQKTARAIAKAKAKQDRRIARKQGELKREQERLERFKEGKDTFCDRHPKICKTGKAVAGVGAAAGATALVGAAVATGSGEALGGLALGTGRPKEKKGQSVKEPQSRKPTAKTPTVKRNVSTGNKKKTPQKAQKPTQKRTTTSKGMAAKPKAPKKSQKPVRKRTTATKKTVAKKSTKKRSEGSSSWWEYGGAGL